MTPVPEEVKNLRLGLQEILRGYKAGGADYDRQNAIRVEYTLREVDRVILIYSGAEALEKL